MVDRSNAEEIRTQIIMQGGRSLWSAQHIPPRSVGGNVQIVDGYSLNGRVIVVHEFWNPRTDTRSAVDAYVPVHDGNRMDDTLAAIQNWSKS